MKAKAGQNAKSMKTAKDFILPIKISIQIMFYCPVNRKVVNVPVMMAFQFTEINIDDVNEYLVSTDWKYIRLFNVRIILT